MAALGTRCRTALPRSSHRKSLITLTLRREAYDMKYQVLLEPSEEGVAVSVPGLPGCWSQGATELEALANITAAIQEYLKVVKELNQGRDLREVDVGSPPGGGSS